MKLLLILIICLCLNGTSEAENDGRNNSSVADKRHYISPIKDDVMTERNFEPETVGHDSKIKDNDLDIEKQHDTYPKDGTMLPELNPTSPVYQSEKNDTGKRFLNISY